MMAMVINIMMMLVGVGRSMIVPEDDGCTAINIVVIVKMAAAILCMAMVIVDRLW